jgi:hypothetical protein
MLTLYGQLKQQALPKGMGRSLGLPCEVMGLGLERRMGKGL